MTDKAFTLPTADIMHSRLLKVDDEGHLQERFYPKLLKHAGMEKVPMGVVMMLQLAIYDYVKGMPPMMGKYMNMRMPELIDAVCPDEESAKEAKAFFEKVQSQVK